jgi:hypothetical protein
MDIRKDGWFARLQVNGKSILLDNSRNMASTGSIMRIFADALKSISAERAKQGDVTIQLTIANHVLSDARVAEVSRISEVESLLDGQPDETLPRKDESYEDYHARLLEQGFTNASAIILACQWFNKEPDHDIELWLNDTKAIRFRELNSRDEAYASALPEEYESLKNYVKTTYPEFVEHITFRTA